MTAAEIQALRERRAAVWQEMQNVNDVRDRALTRAELDQWDKLEGELNTLTEQIGEGEREQRLRGSFSEHQRTLGQPADPVIDTSRVDGGVTGQRDARTAAYTSWLRYGRNGLTTEEREALGDPTAVSKELRAQGVATGAAGGYTVPEGFRARIAETMKSFGGMRRAGAEIITTESGNPLPWPTNDDTDNEGAILAENTQVTEQDLVLDTAELGAYVYTSKLVRVSLQLLQDSGVDIEAFLTRKLGERLGRVTNRHYTTGTGIGQPEGIVTGAQVGKTAASQTAITYDEALELVHSVDAAYRDAGNPNWMFNDLALVAFRKLKDGQQRPLWQPSIQAGVPDLFLGYPYVINNHMPEPAAEAKPIAFGDFAAAYVIRDVLGIQQLRLEERYADFLQVGFLAFLRTDGRVQDSGAVKVLQMAAAG
jgi:HK97 family phage major capsid protein